MKKIFYLILFFYLWGGIGCGAKEEAVIRIDHIAITKSEFEHAFAGSRFASKGESGRKEYLEVFITSKLMLKEAQEKGLDKEPEFLSDIQMFWEKALLKNMIAAKVSEIDQNATVTSQEVLQYYQAQKDREFVGKELSDVFSQIEWRLIQEKQRKALVDWEQSLKRRSRITVDWAGLGVAP